MMASGHSQIMDGPGQEPSVSLLDWSSGRGTQVDICNVFVVGSIVIIDHNHRTGILGHMAPYSCIC